MTSKNGDYCIRVNVKGVLTNVSGDKFAISVLPLRWTTIQEVPENYVLYSTANRPTRLATYYVSSGVKM